MFILPLRHDLLLMSFASTYFIVKFRLSSGRLQPRKERVKCAVEEMRVDCVVCGLSRKHLIFYSWVTCVTSAGFTGKESRFTVSTEEKVEALTFSFPLTQLSCTVNPPAPPPHVSFIYLAFLGLCSISSQKSLLLSRVTLTASDRVTKGVPWSLDWMSVFK